MIPHFALTLTALLLFIGLAIDAALLQWQSMRMQFAADAAAVEGMYEIARFNSSWAAAAQAQATMNGFTNGVNGVTVTVTQPNTYAANVSVSRPFSTFFLQALGAATNPTISLAAAAQSDNTCIWIRSPGSASSASVALLSATMTTYCGIHINSATGVSLLVDANSGLLNNANRIRIVGPASGNISTGYVGIVPNYGAAAKNDPLAYVTAPTLGSCQHNNYSLSNKNATISAGTYCGGITVSNGTLTLNAGLYVITGGLNLTDGTLDGTSGVTLYFTQSSLASGAMLWFDHATVSLKAPTSTASGGLTGICVFIDRSWVNTTNPGITIVYSGVTADGFWYAANTGMDLTQTTFGSYSYSGLDVYSFFEDAASATFTADYSLLGGWSPLHYQDGNLTQ